MTTTAVQPQLVHESEAQRQYARVKIPATLVVDIDGQPRTLPIHDLSAGGFSLKQPNDQLTRNQVYSGRLVFQIDGLDLGMEVRFVPKNQDSDAGRCGYEFQELGASEVSTLRYVITSFLSGEVVSAGDVLNTLSRENFTRTRKNKGGEDLGAFARARALIGSLLFMLVGLGAASFVLWQLWQMYFVTRAESAMVGAEQVSITVPKDARVTTLVKAGQQVEAGAVIATFDAPMLSYVSDLLGEGDYTVEQIEELLGQSVRGTLTSPCDCTVANLRPAKDQYMAKGDQLALLAPADASTHVIARFKFEDGEDLEEGQTVTLKLPGGETQAGTISALYVDARQPNQPGTAINTLIEANQPLPISAIGRPIRVTVEPFQNSVLNAALAGPAGNP